MATDTVLGPAPGVGASARHSTPRRVELRVGIGLIVAVALACLVIPLVDHADPTALGALPLQPPSVQHPFGTDTVGRDVFIRVFTAGRLDIALAALGASVPLLVGTVVGTMVGATRRRGADVVAMRLTDGVIAFPFVVLILVIVLVVGPSAEICRCPPVACRSSWPCGW